MVSVRNEKSAKWFKAQNSTTFEEFSLDGSGSHREIGKSKETGVVSVMFGISSVSKEGQEIWSAADFKGKSYHYHMTLGLCDSLFTCGEAMQVNKSVLASSS